MNKNPGNPRAVASGNGNEAESATDVGKPSLTAEPEKPSASSEPAPVQATEQTTDRATERAEYGGPKGPEPTRYGDWERNGRCYDF